MSVVNKMLQDLEQRQGQEASSANYQAPAKKSLTIRTIVWIAVVVLCVATVGYIYLFNDSHSDTQPLASQPVTPINQQVGSSASTEESESVSSDVSTASEEGDDDIPETSPDATGTSAQAPAAEAEQQTDTSARNIAQTVVSPSSQPMNSDEEVIKEVPEPSVLSITKNSDSAPKLGLLQRARRATNQNNPSVAMSLWQQLIRQEPDNVEAYKSLAALHFGQGDVALARQTLETAINSVAPGDDTLKLMLSRLHTRQGEDAAAYRVLQTSGTTSGIDVLSNRAALAQKLGDLGQAISDYQRLIDIQPATAKWWLGLAVTADKQGDLKRAENAYQKAVALGQLDNDVTSFMHQRIVVLGKKLRAEVKP